MTSTVLVVPCFNEEARLEPEGFLEVARAPGFTVLFVDDGSRDGTMRVLEAIRDREPTRVRVLHLDKNGGKGEAVRKGMLEGLQLGADIIGFADADLATPPGELIRLRDELAESDLSVVVGSRVLLMGTDIQRDPWRHYIGRFFATAAANVLAMPFYDTQCGAKYFRDRVALAAALEQPFVSRWVFDLELLGRLHFGTGSAPPVPLHRFEERTLRRWVAVADSKLTLKGMSRALLDLRRVHVELERLRARAAREGHRSAPSPR